MSRRAMAHRYLPRFSFRAVLAVTLLLGAVAGMYGRRVALQRRAVQQVQALGGEVFYSYEYDPNASRQRKSDALPPHPWVCDLVGRDSLYPVVYVRFVVATHSDDDLACLRGLPAIRELQFEECVFRNDALAPIASLQSMEVLKIWASDLADRDLRHLEPLRNLRTLNLEECRGITGGDFHHWIQLGKLENLFLGSTQIDDDAMAELSRLELPRLRVLSFGGTQVSDRALKSIIQMRTLDTIFVGSHTMTQDGLRALYAARPDLTFLN